MDPGRFISTFLTDIRIYIHIETYKKDVTTYSRLGPASRAFPFKIPENTKYLHPKNDKINNITLNKY